MNRSQQREANGQEVPAIDKSRWNGIQRDFTHVDVEKLSGTLHVRHTIAERGATRLWELLHERPYVAALGAQTGNQALQMAKAGLESIYVSGWQVAADANESGHMYPDQSLYPCSSVPSLVRRINNSFIRADQIQKLETYDRDKGTHLETTDDSDSHVDYFLPCVADAESGFGGALNAYELARSLIESGAAGIHFEDQLASEKKCGHLGGKVLVPTSSFIRTLNAARLAADVAGVPTILIARTDAHSAQFITCDADPRDAPFILTGGKRTPDGFFPLRQDCGVDHAIARGLAYAPYADLLWWETSEPNLKDAKRFADAIHEKFPGKLLSYNCSPSFNWGSKLSPQDISTFQQKLGEMGYKYQFVTLAGFHSLSYHTFALARAYKERGMSAYSELQQAEFAATKQGYTAVRHQREVGTGYFDAISVALGNRSTTALAHSTEDEQFTTGEDLEENQEEKQAQAAL